jgi:hypothetical protein
MALRSVRPAAVIDGFTKCLHGGGMATPWSVTAPDTFKSDILSEKPSQLQASPPLPHEPHLMYPD